uniref:RNA-directed DNA polymerase, eukaryota n=1 Tax=Tanacetum cinerariifolium TaxID=118510 RepID=A0A699HEM7_TANCI|nr:RNA-directed DNA polymerase, eukaryota [Tanacetum cinerariifolium]
MHVVKGQVQSGIREEEMSPALVLDDKCLISKDVSKCLLGRVKEFASLANLKMALYNECFMDIKIQYMGEFLVLMEFVNEKSLKLFRDNVSAISWFLQVIQASLDFVTKGRIAWIEIEGIPLKIWSDNTFKRIAAKWGELLDIDDHEETCFHSKRLCILTKDYRSILEDFKIVFRGKTNDQYDDEIKNGGINGQETGNDVNSDAVEVPETAVEKKRQEENNVDEESLKKTGDKSEDPFNIYPLLNKNNDNEDGTSNNYEKVNEVNVEEFQNLSGNGCSKYSKEVESDSICSGRFKKSKGPKTGGSILNLLDEVVKVGQSDSIGNSGGILCVWDPNSFCKSSVTISDSFVMMRGVWRQSGKDVLLIAVYAPHDFKEKLLLWDYLNRSIGRWNGEVIIMGDFNKVRYKSDRFGTVFHTQGANAFNSFIYSAGLVEVSLGGCSFTYLSDHRPILLRESYFDYGPTPFRFFHYRSDLEVFGNVVEAAWKEYPNVEQNAMTNMMGKLKHLKKKIREWNIKDKQRMSMDKDKYKVDLEALDMIIDQGNRNEEIVKQRSEIVSKFLHIDKLSSVEMAQKAKVKWSIEGDENTSFFHGREFFNHFRNRFDKPNGICAIIHMEYPRRISLDKQSELEGEVSNDEIKRAVWDCGTDKAPGPDGFTFGFYRRFWYLVDNDVHAAVKHFFIHGEIPKGCNSSFIALIMKILDANLVKDFRPISLIGSLYKIIAKILANRLAGVLGDIVNEVQFAFVADRQILDGPFILNEDIQWWRLAQKSFPTLVYSWFTVGEKMRQPSLEFSFRRNTRGGVEQEQLGDLVTLMHDVSLSPMADRWTWALENSGEFTVSSVRKHIDDKLIPRVGSKTRWIKYVPIKVNVNAWKSRDIEAFVFSCNMVRQTTRMIKRWWDVSYVDFIDYDDWRTWIINLWLPSKNKMMLEVKALFFDDVRTKSYSWCRVVRADPEDSSESEEEEPLPAQPTPTPPTQLKWTPSFRPYRLHPNGPLMLFTPRKTVCAPRPPTPSIDAAITESIALPP